MATEAPTLTALLKKAAAAYPGEHELAHAVANLPETLGKLEAVFGAPVLEEKLSPAEAEAVLRHYPAANQAVPFGVPDDKYGDEEVFAANKKIRGGPAAAGVGQNNGGFTELLCQGLPVLGLSIASVAVTGLAAGAATPATGLGLFLMLIVGLSTVTIRVLRA